MATDLSFRTYTCYYGFAGIMPGHDSPVDADPVAAHRLSDVTDVLVWIDCEMTGLDLERDVLIEVAALVTDADLNILGDGVDVVIHAPDDVLDNMVEFVRDMHAKSGLTEAVRDATVTVSEAEDMIMEYVTRYAPAPGTAPLCGNSIATDRGFLARDM